MSTTLNGNWIHRSFRNDLTVPGGVAGAGSPILAAPWAPPGKFEVQTGAVGDVTGKLTFPNGKVLSVTGQISEPVAAGVAAPWAMPASVVLTAVIDSTEYYLRGWFVPDSNTIVGTVMAIKNDLAKAPDGTQGPWVLTQVQEA